MNIPAFLKNLKAIIFQDVEISHSESFQRYFSFSAFPLIKEKFEDNPEDFQDDIKAFFRVFYRSWEKVNVGKEKKLLTSSGQDERTKSSEEIEVSRYVESDCVVCMRNEIEEIGRHFNVLDLRYNTFINLEQNFTYKKLSFENFLECIKFFNIKNKKNSDIRKFPFLEKIIELHDRKILSISCPNLLNKSVAFFLRLIDRILIKNICEKHGIKYVDGIQYGNSVKKEKEIQAHRSMVSFHENLYKNEIKSHNFLM